MLCINLLLGLAIGLIVGTWMKRQGIKERDEEIERLRNLIEELQYYHNKENKNDEI